MAVREVRAAVARRPSGTSRSQSQLGPRVGETITLLLVSVAVSVVVTWPLLLHLNTVTHDRIDPLHTSWLLNWVQYALLHGRNPYNTNAFAPQTLTLAYSDALLGTAVLLFPLHWLPLTPVGLNNAGVILGFALSAAAGYYFGRVVTGSRTVAAITGAAYSFGPFGTAQGGNLQMVMRPGVPLAAAAAWLMAEGIGPRRRQELPALLLVGAVAWQASSSIYLGVYSVLVALIVAGCRLRAFRGRWPIPGLAFVTASASLGVFLLPYLIVKQRFPNAGNFARPFGIDFSHTDPRLAVWGHLLGKGRGWPVYAAAEPAFPGVALTALALIGIVVLARRREGRALLVVGTSLVIVGLFLATGFGRSGPTAYLPYRFLFDYVPGFRALRSAGRIWCIALLGLGLLAGSAVHHFVSNIVQRRPSRELRRVLPGLAAAVVVGAIVLEGYAPWRQLPRIAIRPVNRALARRHDHRGVLYLPMTSSESGNAIIFLRQAEDLYNTTVHHRVTPDGYAGFVPPTYYRTGELMHQLPNRRSLAFLHRIGVGYIVLLNGGAAWSYLGDPARAAPLRLVGRYGPDLLYEIPS